MLYSRLTIIILLFTISICYDILSFKFLSKGIGIYQGLLHVNSVTIVFYIFICILSACILTLTSFKPHKILLYIKQRNLKINLLNKLINLSEQFRIIEYPLIILFVITGAIFLMSSNDLVTYSSQTSVTVLFSPFTFFKALNTSVNASKASSLFNPAVRRFIGIAFNGILVENINKSIGLVGKWMDKNFENTKYRNLYLKLKIFIPLIYNIVEFFSRVAVSVKYILSTSYLLSRIVNYLEENFNKIYIILNLIFLILYTCFPELIPESLYRYIYTIQELFFTHITTSILRDRSQNRVVNLKNIFSISITLLVAIITIGYLPLLCILFSVSVIIFNSIYVIPSLIISLKNLSQNKELKEKNPIFYYIGMMIFSVLLLLSIYHTLLCLELLIGVLRGVWKMDHGPNGTGNNSGSPRGGSPNSGGPNPGGPNPGSTPVVPGDRNPKKGKSKTGRTPEEKVAAQKASKKKYTSKNAEKVAAYNKDWCNKNREKRQLDQKVRRDNKKLLAGGTNVKYIPNTQDNTTPEEWEEILKNREKRNARYAKIKSDPVKHEELLAKERIRHRERTKRLNKAIANNKKTNNP